MTNSEDPQGMPFGTYEDYLGREPETDPEPDVFEQYPSFEDYVRDNPPVLGVLTGQYPAPRTMPITGTPPRQDLDGEFLDDESGSA